MNLPVHASEEAINVYLEFAQRYQNDRVGFARNVLGFEPDPFQLEVLEAMDRGERRISVRSGHGVGKSGLAGVISSHAMSCYGIAKVIQTAPSGPQLWDALFAETKMWFGRLPEALRDLFRLGSDRIESIAAPEQLFVSARTSRAETPEALQGVHAEGGIVILIADEASGIPDAVFEAGSGSMSGHNCYTLLFSNPTRINGFFFDTHHRLKHMWRCLHVSCLNSPRVSRDYIEDMKARYGEESNAYRVRVLGEFPIRDDSTYIPLELVTAAQDREIIADKGVAERFWGLDVARFGSDKTVLTKRWGKVVPEVPRVWKGFDTMQVAGAIKHEYDKTEPDEKPVEILVDVIGIGAGVVDRLVEMKLPVRGINVAESPACDPTGKYDKLRDELWAKGREFIEALDCKLPNDEGFLELAMPRYTFKSNGEMKIESKQDFKKRLGFSPDFADSFLLTLAAGTLMGAGGRRSDWSKPVKRNLKGVV